MIEEEVVRKPKSKLPVARMAERKGRAIEAVPLRACLIRIADKEARNRAVMVLGEVRVPYCGFTDHRLLVTREHIALLRRESIPFEELS
jgi:hypothetical protein